MALTRISTQGLGNSVSFNNINDTGTEGTKIATGTTAQRGSTQISRLLSWTASSN